jgi:addiction module HigA family antidote
MRCSSRAIGVPPRRINEIVLGKRSFSADADLRLARYFGVSDGFWLGLQAGHDLLRRRRELMQTWRAVWAGGMIGLCPMRCRASQRDARGIAYTPIAYFDISMILTPSC